MKLEIWCKKCGASLELTKYRANNKTTYALVHSKNFLFEKECKFTNIVLGIKFGEDD